MRYLSLRVRRIFFSSLVLLGAVGLKPAQGAVLVVELGDPFAIQREYASLRGFVSSRASSLGLNIQFANITSENANTAILPYPSGNSPIFIFEGHSNEGRAGIYGPGSVLFSAETLADLILRSIEKHEQSTGKKIVAPIEINLETCFAAAPSFSPTGPLGAWRLEQSVAQKLANALKNRGYSSNITAYTGVLFVSPNSHGKAYIGKSDMTLGEYETTSAAWKARFTPEKLGLMPRDQVGTRILFVTRPEKDTEVFYIKDGKPTTDTDSISLKRQILQVALVRSYRNYQERVYKESSGNSAEMSRRMGILEKIRIESERLISELYKTNVEIKVAQDERDQALSLSEDCSLIDQKLSQLRRERDLRVSEYNLLSAKHVAEAVKPGSAELLKILSDLEQVQIELKGQRG